MAWATLTDRQRQIARLVAAGRASKEIARLLALSPLTVRTQRRTIFARLGVHNVADLASGILALDQRHTPSE